MLLKCDLTVTLNHIDLVHLTYFIRELFLYPEGVESTGLSSGKDSSGKKPLDENEREE